MSKVVHRAPPAIPSPAPKPASNAGQLILVRIPLGKIFMDTLETEIRKQAEKQLPPLSSGWVFVKSTFAGISADGLDTLFMVEMIKL